MAEDLFSIRLEKVDKLREKDMIPYAERYPCTHTVKEAMALPDGAQAKFAGRLMARRSFGKLTFAELQDMSGKGQICFEKPKMNEDAKWMTKNALDMGDFIGVAGEMFTTRKGERTLAVKEVLFLSKSLRPLPEKWHGLKDKELQYRQRYLDLIMNEDTRNRFHARTKVVKIIRRFLDERGFLEVETPILQAASSGAAARPFKTYHNALQQDFFLRISPETYLKRLVVGGMEKVYEIGKNFRNEGVDPSHLQEFTMLEWYAAYWNYRDNMNLIKEMIQHVLKEVHGSLEIEYQGQKLNFSQWPEIDYCQAIKEETGIDILEFETRDELAKKIAKEYKEVEVEKCHSLPALIDALYKQVIRPKLIQPCFLIHHPTVLVPLARRNDDNKNILDMFQVVINTWEMVKAYSELVDPVDQKNRMLEQLEYREQGDDETMMMEEDYIRCMEHGMPPISGLGLGIDRFVALLSNSESLRDVVFFPNLRNEVRKEAEVVEESEEKKEKKPEVQKKEKEQKPKKQGNKKKSSNKK